MGKKVQFNDKPYVKEDYQGLQLIGTPSHNCEVSDDVFDGSKGILRPYMVPMFKGEPYNLPAASNFQGKLDLYTGNVKKMLDRPQKKENMPLWQPFKETYLLNKNDIYTRASAEESIKHYNDSFLSARPFEFPTEPIFVKRGLGLGYTAEGDPNPFHSQWRPPVKTVDELRGWVRPTFAMGRVEAGVSAHALGVNPITNPIKSKTRRQDAVYGLSIKDTVMPSIFKGDYGTPCRPEGPNELIKKRSDKKLYLQGAARAAMGGLVSNVEHFANNGDSVELKEPKRSANVNAQSGLYMELNNPMGEVNYDVALREPKQGIQNGKQIAPFVDANNPMGEASYDVALREPKRGINKGKRIVAPFMNLNTPNYDVEIKEKRLPVLKGANGQLKPLYYQSYTTDTNGKAAGRVKKENKESQNVNIEGESVGFIQKLVGKLNAFRGKNEISFNTNASQIDVPTSLLNASGQHVDIQLKLPKEVLNLRNEQPTPTGPIAGTQDRAKHRERAEKLRLEAVRMSSAMNSGVGVEMPRGNLADVKLNDKRSVFSYRNPDYGPRVQGHVRAPAMVPLGRIAPDAPQQIFAPLTAPPLAGYNNQILLGENTKKNRRLLYGERDAPNAYSSFGR